MTGIAVVAMLEDLPLDHWPRPLVGLSGWSCLSLSGVLGERLTREPSWFSSLSILGIVFSFRNNSRRELFPDFAFLRSPRDSTDFQSEVFLSRTSWSWSS